MSNNAISAQGSKLRIDKDTVGTADLQIKGLVSFSGFDGEASEQDISNLDSEAKEFSLGLKDNGSFSAETHVDYDDPGQNEARAAAVSGALKSFELELPNTKKVQFKGLVKNADSINGGVDQVLTGSISIKISGPLTKA